MNKKIEKKLNECFENNYSSSVKFLINYEIENGAETINNMNAEEIFQDYINNDSYKKIFDILNYFEK